MPEEFDTREQDTTTTQDSCTWTDAGYGLHLAPDVCAQGLQGAGAGLSAAEYGYGLLPCLSACATRKSSRSGLDI